MVRMDQANTNTSKSPAGKSITTSVPTIKFSAGAEEVVEVYSSCCEEEMAAVSGTGSPKHERERSTTPVDCCDTTTATSTPSSDPWRFFSGIKGKITKSVEGRLIEYKNKSAISAGVSEQETAAAAAAAAAVSNARSPKHHKHTNNSSSAGNSRSDSEDISESSLSKTQGGLSTTEGAEMSSTDECDDEDDEDDGTPSQSQHSVATHLEDPSSNMSKLTAPAVVNEQQATTTGGLRYRLRTIRGGNVTVGETTVGDSFLRALQRLTHNTEDSNDITHNNYADVRTEEGVDVLEGLDVDGAYSGQAMEPLDLNIENVTVRSDDVIEVHEVLGSEIRASLQANLAKTSHQSNNNNPIVDTCTVYNPTEFVDLRHLKGIRRTKSNSTTDYKIRRAICVTVVFLVAYFVLSPISVYLSGFVLGVVSTLVVVRVRSKWIELTSTNSTPTTEDVKAAASPIQTQQTEVIAASDDNLHQTVWMNEWPAVYTPQTYSVTGTQPVHLRLQRHLLRVSNTNARLPKRDMQTGKDINSSSATYTYSRHRIYDLRGATVSLLPVGLTRIRWWSKKYPICVQLASPYHLTTQDQATTNDSSELPVATSTSDKHQQPQVFKQVVRKRRKWHQHNSARDSTVQFSKLMYDDNMTDKDVAPTTSSNMIDTLDLAVPLDSNKQALTDSKETTTTTTAKDPPETTAETTDDEHNNVTRLYLFARSCRDKETWYQLLTSATCIPTVESLASSAIYKNYMDTILSASQRLNNSPATEEKTTTSTAGAEDGGGTTSENLIWLNALLGRAWFSYAMGGEGATMRLKDRIQRKLATIRLPAFIEELKLSELSVSPPKMFEKVSPIRITWASRPLLDERGVWVDLDIEYESSVVLILQTKLNLMRLKSKGVTTTTTTMAAAAAAESECDGGESFEIVPQRRSAIFHSDVDDSAESSSDDDSGGDSDRLIQQDAAAAAAAASATTADVADAEASSTVVPAQSPNHKLIRMVDRIADSRLFRAATEYRYVQRALENVRNTDICLRVEVKSISGRLCINIPPPPSDRLWFGFRATPEPPRLRLKALPTVGDYHISLQHVTGWLEKRLIREFHKVLVLPNMEDIVLPGLK